MNKIVFDLNEWIPPGGEDRIAHRIRAGGDLEISIEYERDESPHIIRLVFDGAFYFVNQPFPGPDILKPEYDDGDVGFLELAELSDSGLAQLSIEDWTRGYESITPPDFRHYFMYSYEMNQLFHIVAESVAIEHEPPSPARRRPA